MTVSFKLYDVIVLLTPPSWSKRHWFLTNCPYRLKSKKLHFIPAQLAAQSFIIKIMTWFLLFSSVRKEHPHSKKANELRLIFMLILNTRRNKKKKFCLFAFIEMGPCFFSFFCEAGMMFLCSATSFCLCFPNHYYRKPYFKPIVRISFRTPNIIPMHIGKAWFSPYAHKRYQ